MDHNPTIEELNSEYIITGKRLRFAMVVSATMTIILLVLSILFILQNQQQAKEQIIETKKQGEINQKYIRCIILLPAASFHGTNEERAKSIDDCAIKSKLPDNS